MLWIAIGIGFVTGLRSMTAPAVVCWAARMGWITLASSFAWFGHAAALGLFTAGAVGELLADKSSKIPSRTTPGPFGFRVVSGALCGGALCTSGGGAAAVGLAGGALGAVFGTLLGYKLRTGTVRRLNVPDFPVALVEDVIAVGGGFWLASQVRAL